MSNNNNTIKIVWNRCELSITKLNDTQYQVQADYRKEIISTIVDLDDDTLWQSLQAEDNPKHQWAKSAVFWIMKQEFVARHPNRKANYTYRDRHLGSIRSILRKSLKYHRVQPITFVIQDQTATITPTQGHNRYSITISERNEPKNIILNFSFNRVTKKLVFKLYNAEIERNEVAKFYAKQYGNINVEDKQLEKHKQTLQDMLQDEKLYKTKKALIQQTIDKIDNNINALYL